MRIRPFFLDCSLTNGEIVGLFNHIKLFVPIIFKPKLKKKMIGGLTKAFFKVKRIRYFEKNECIREPQFPSSPPSPHKKKQKQNNSRATKENNMLVVLRVFI